MSSVEFDMDIFIEYAIKNWDITKTEPDEIYRNTGSSNQIRHWMFVNCIEMIEDDTIYEIGDMNARMNSMEDTEFPFKVWSREGDKSAKVMFIEFIRQLRNFAKTNDAGIYTFTQITMSKPSRKAYFTYIDGNMLMTRRGKKIEY